MKGEIFSGQNKDKLNRYKHKEGAGPGPSFLNALNTSTFQVPQMPPSSIKDHILEPGEDWMRCAQGRKRVILSGFLRGGFLCRLLHNGNKMEVIDVVGDAISDKKMILTGKKKKNILESILFQNPGDIFKGRLSGVEGAQKLPGPHSLVLTCYFIVLSHGVTCHWTKEQRVQARPWDRQTPPALWILTLSLMRCVFSSASSVSVYPLCPKTQSRALHRKNWEVLSQD